MFEPRAGTPSLPALLAGKYRLERELGRGGMGVVFLATHIALERQVAIKIMLPALAENSNAIQRLLREARCAAMITSEHVVRVMDTGQLDTGQPFIVMEYVEGEDLARVLGRQQRLPLLVGVHWVIEACVAIAEAHEKNIVHRDLKPANLFLARGADGREQIKVLDFGISKQLDATGEQAFTRATDVMGSPHYMAPEQIRSPLLVDVRADIWALGVILSELLTGVRAFAGETITAVYTRVLEGEPDMPEPVGAELPVELANLLRRCMRKDPNERFQSVHDLAAALAPFAPARSATALGAIARHFGRTAVEAGRSPSRPPTAAFTPGSMPLLPGFAPPAALRRRFSILPGLLLGLALSGAAGFLVQTELVHGRDAQPPAPSALYRSESTTLSPLLASMPRFEATDAGGSLERPRGPERQASEPEPRITLVRGTSEVAAPLSAEALQPELPQAELPQAELPQAEARLPLAPAEAVSAKPPSGNSSDHAEGRQMAPSVPPAAAPDSPRNPWDMTTFGGRS
jgi:hypothetical protein